MRIVVIGPVYPYRGGIAHYTTQLSLALQEREHMVQVVSFKRQYPTWLYPGSSDRDPTQVPIKIDAAYLLDPIYPWTWQRTINKIIEYSPDIVVFQWWTPFWSFANTIIEVSLRNQDIPFTCIIHNVFPHEHFPFDQWLARLALGQGQPLIAQNPTEIELLHKLLPNAKVSFCPHPIYPRFSEKLVSKKEARLKLNLPIEIPVLLFFGIVRQYKGLHFLLEAINILRTRSVKTFLVIAGEFWDRKEIYLSQIETLQLSNQVRIEDHYLHNEEVDQYFSAADLLVAPYVGGTQSGAVALAIGYGVPTILTKQIASGIPEDYINQIIVVDGGNADELANAILKTLERPIIRHPTSFTIKSTWDRLVNLIEDKI